ncbi:hypothetical protein [Dinoroseobacter sp. S76]|uniref:hypothetical protein n=1 Tax=Dinoroseobacter sp. S76 TaxID=3415124 RepID=UPI003C7BEA11
MSTQERTALNIPSFEEPMDQLDDFAPRPPVGQGGTITAKAIDAVSSFPSREAATDAQLNLKGPRPVLERFKAMCKADRRAYYDMLEILMDSYEGTTPKR